MQDKFLKLLSEALEREDKIEMTDEFKQYEEWDSLALLEVIAMLDEEYEVEIEDEEMKKLTTVGDLYKKTQIK